MEEHRDDPLLQRLLGHELNPLLHHSLYLLVEGFDPVVREDKPPSPLGFAALRIADSRSSPSAIVFLSNSLKCPYRVPFQCLWQNYLTRNPAFSQGGATPRGLRKGRLLRRHLHNNLVTPPYPISLYFFFNKSLFPHLYKL